jgi:hypothetical protein
MMGYCPQERTANQAIRLVHRKHMMILLTGNLVAFHEAKCRAILAFGALRHFCARIFLVHESNRPGLAAH